MRIYLTVKVLPAFAMRVAYCHTAPSGLTRTREPLQVGAELYGHGGLESDTGDPAPHAASPWQLPVIGENSPRSRPCCGIPGSGQEAPEFLSELGRAELFRAYCRRRTLRVEKFMCWIWINTSMREPSGRCCFYPTFMAMRNTDARKKSSCRAIPKYNQGWMQELQTIGSGTKTTGGYTGLFLILLTLRGYHYHSGLSFPPIPAYLPTRLPWGTL